MISAGGGPSVAAIATTAAATVVILSGLAGLMRVIFKGVIAVRDNTIATDQLSVRVDAMNGVSSRLDEMSARIAALEGLSHES